MTDQTKTTLTSAYKKATDTYSGIMAPIHEINEYVDSKNALDKSKESGMSETEYDTAVSNLKKQYFGDDATRQVIADKAEAFEDWKDAHGITDIEKSFSSAFAAPIKSLKEAFANTGIGKSFAEIQQEANTDTVKTDTAETDKSTVTAKASDFSSGADLPEQMPESEKAAVIEQRQAQRSAAATEMASSVESPDSDSVSTTVPELS